MREPPKTSPGFHLLKLLIQLFLSYQLIPRRRGEETQGEEPKRVKKDFHYEVN